MPIIKHCTGLDIRVRGSGNLLTKLISLDDSRSEVLVPLVMSALPGRTNIIKSNFTEEKMYFEIWIEEIDEKFEITDIVPFVKARATMYPS